MPDDRFEHYKAGASHGIPYRCMVPELLNNVLVAGRCISADHIMQGSIRVMPVCLVTGEAAGTAAALSIKGKAEVSRIDIKQLRTRLKAWGNYLPAVEENGLK